ELNFPHLLEIDGYMMTVLRLGALTPRLAERCWVAPSACVVGNVVLGEGASVWFGATLRGDTPEPMLIGARTNIQDGAVLHSDPGVPLHVGEDVTVGHQAMLHGCTIGHTSLIGIGATVLNRAVVGSHCIIGAHALIPEGKTIPDGSLVMGAPGRVVKQLTEEQIEGLRASAAHYVENAQRFREELQVVEEAPAPRL
ncbi:MAG: hypothetical protein SGPRY_005045, partial [Prymnesium sp.]